MIEGKNNYLKNLRFFDLLDCLNTIKNNPEYKECQIKVFIECGFLNGGNRHFKSAASTAFNGKISEHVGENHQIAKKICEMCEYLGLEYHQVKPTKSKHKSDSFQKITGINSRTNQEQRDAFMLIFGR